MSQWAWSIQLWVTLALAALPLVMTLGNLRRLHRLGREPSRKSDHEPKPASCELRPSPSSLRVCLSVLIPARNEQAGIAAAVQAVLASTFKEQDAELEVIVLDDHSTDATASIVRQIARRDPRVRLEHASPLPPAWNGKQYACHRLADLARFDRLTWIDADVRLAPHALAAMIRFHEASGAALVSGFPHQVTGTWLEKLVIPLIPAVLVGYLPIKRMRASTAPAYGAGCGQWFMAWREAYRQAGGHAAIRASRHDGMTLPRAFRRAGLMTDVGDAGEVASCRMYPSASQVWQGLAKNATEAMATPASIGGWTVLLLGGWVWPWVNLAALAGVWLSGGAVERWQIIPATGAAVMAGATSAILGRRFHQPRLAVLGRPIGVAALVAIQWYALIRAILGKPVAWRGRGAVPP